LVFTEPKNMPERVYRADLHIHSVLSPCAERDMLPHCIILEALEKHLDIIAITDHNSCENVQVTISLGEQFGVWVIPGMEVETREEIHFLTYFPTYQRVLSFYQVLQQFFQPIPLDENLWGEEWVIGAAGQIVEKKKELLTFPLSLTVEELYQLVVIQDGIIIPSHVDRSVYSIIGVLGFLPPYPPFPVLEISSALATSNARAKLKLNNCRLVRFSDAHALPQVGLVYTEFRMDRPCWVEFKKAINQMEGRDFFPQE
jgi:PHP family Zn ribbon phosphoesterase